jgi:hypothetical protein
MSAKCFLADINRKFNKKVQFTDSTGYNRWQILSPILIKLYAQECTSRW